MPLHLREPQMKGKAPMGEPPREPEPELTVEDYIDNEGLYDNIPGPTYEEVHASEFPHIEIPTRMSEQEVVRSLEQASVNADLAMRAPQGNTSGFRSYFILSALLLELTSFVL